MIATAFITYSIKHRSELKREEVVRLEEAIKLENDTIDLLKVDWALLTQPSRLSTLGVFYKKELQLQPTDPLALALPVELPMLRSELPLDNRLIASQMNKPKIDLSQQKKFIKNKKLVFDNKGFDNLVTGAVQH